MTVTAKTQYLLENLEHSVVSLIDDNMYSILDNGDRPDRRIEAIVGLHFAKRTILRSLDKLTLSVADMS